jgi:hypothetical protein
MGAKLGQVPSSQENIGLVCVALGDIGSMLRIFLSEVTPGQIGEFGAVFVFLLRDFFAGVVSGWGYQRNSLSTPREKC